MFRVFILLSLIVIVSTVVKAEVDPGQVSSMALAQIQHCLDLRVTGVASMPVARNEIGLSFRGLGATLGIGLMTLLFFVPAALFSEFLMRRGEQSDQTETA